MKIPALMASLFALTSIELASAPLPLEQWQQQGENTLRRQQQRFQELQSRLLNEREGSRLSSSQASDRPLELNESPCFPITTVVLEGEASERFQFALDEALNQAHFEEGICLGSQGIQVLLERVQNAIVARGYSTTRVLVGKQNLTSGRLVFTVIPGRLRAIRYDDTDKDHTHIGRIMAWGNQFPVRAGDVLNLHALEQGLENLRRNPTASAQLQIVPADKPNWSDVVVSWRQRLIPWRLMMSVDDAGNRYTGKYQGNISIAADNPLGLSDLLYVNFSHDLGHKTQLVDAQGERTSSRTQGFGFHYSVPFGYWLFSVNHQTYEYHQAIEGLQQNYDYSGKSRLSTLDVRRVLYRDDRRKTDGHVSFWTRENESFIDGVALDVQHRRQAGWTLGLAHQERVGEAILDFGLDYKRGTGANESALSPETGGSHMQVLTWDAALSWPFTVFGQASVAMAERPSRSTQLDSLDRS